MELNNFFLSQIGLGLTIWHGIFEGLEYDWLRWCDASGNILLTGNELAQQEKQRAEQAQQQAEQVQQQAEQLVEQAQQRADRLLEILRERGINPDEVL